MDVEQSYFARTNWFIWIGFLSSALMFLLVGVFIAPEWKAPEYHPPQIGFFALLATSLVLFIFTRRKLKKLNQMILPKEERLVHDGKITVFYSFYLLFNELFLIIGFTYGFILFERASFLNYTTACLLLHAVSLPNVMLGKMSLDAPKDA